MREMTFTLPVRQRRAAKCKTAPGGQSEKRRKPRRIGKLKL